MEPPQSKSGRRFVLKHEVAALLRKADAGRYIDGSKFLCCYTALLGPGSHDLDAIKDLCSRVIAGLRRLAVDEPLRTRILARAAGHVFQKETPTAVAGVDGGVAARKHSYRWRASSGRDEIPQLKLHKRAYGTDWVHFELKKAKN